MHFILPRQNNETLWYNNIWPLHDRSNHLTLKILAKLGEGGMDIVYEALDVKLDCHAVLKFLPPDPTRDRQAKERFILEAKAASSLDHPKVCTIYEINETVEGHLFIALDVERDFEESCIETVLGCEYYLCIRIMAQRTVNHHKRPHSIVI